MTAYRAARAVVLGLAAGALLSACAGSGPRTVLQGFDAGDGRLLWSVDLGRSGGATEPVIVGDSVFVGTAAYGVADGQPRWVQRQAGELPEAVAGDVVVFSLEGRLVARRAGTGAVAWTRRTPGELIRSREDGPIALVTDRRPRPDPGQAPRPGNLPPIVGSQVSLLDPATGEDVWTTVLPGPVDTFYSAVSSRHVFAAYATDHSGNRTVAALRRQDGSTAWSVPATSHFSGVASVNGIPAVLTGGDTDHASVRDPATGEQMWEVSGWAGLARKWPFVQVVPGEPGHAGRRDPRTGAELPGRVPVLYGVAAHGDVLVGAAGRALTATRGADQLWTAALPPGERPMTYLDVDDSVVVAMTSVNHPPYRD